MSKILLTKLNNSYTLEVGGAFYSNIDLTSLKEEIINCISDYEGALKLINEEMEKQNG